MTELLFRVALNNEVLLARFGLVQGFPTFFAARTPLSGQSILSTPQKNFAL